MANQVSQHAGKYARFELERRFLVEHLPEGIEHEHGWRITDRYVKNTHLRLRRMEPIHGGDPILKLGQKQAPLPPDFGRMTTTNLYLSAAEYTVLANLDALELHKRRYPFARDDRTFSIDVFDGTLSGLALAETSFDKTEEMDQPLDLPSWLGREVTKDGRFTGAALASLNPDQAAELLRETTPS
jgi:CYTH domain-containing protein